jgi:tRNA nucleotidyltransferase (CCA-adding enzyme)
MKNKITLDYPNKLNIIFGKLDKYDIKIILIGGYVRDFLLNIRSKDIDIELFNIKSFTLLEEILKEFGDVNSVGKSFGVCKLKYCGVEVDFSLPRTDSKHTKGHKGFEVSVDSTLDFKTAASRRDFTINAMGFDVKKEEFLDPFNGFNDLKNSLIKAVDLNKFGEDPLRVLRAVQFASRFNFTLEKALFTECKKMIKEEVLKELPKERIFTELQKLLLKSSQPSLGLKLAKELGVVNYFGEYETLAQLDYFAMNKTANDKTDILIFLTLLYEEKSFNQLHNITNEVKLIQNIALFLELKNSFSVDSFSDYTLYLLATKVNIEIFFFYLNALYLGKKEQNILKMRTRAEELDIVTEKLTPFIQGRDLIGLGLKASKEFKNILDETYEMQMQGVFHTKEEAIKYLKNYLRDRS